jgi:CarD family transcriptional regulator
MNRKGEGLVMFSIGEYVVHPMHGAGIIDNIVQEKVAGIIKDYYVFKMPMSGLVLKIPVANSQMIGIRSVISYDDAESLLNTIPTMSVEINSNWNKRYQENLMRLKSGDLFEVARVVKMLMLRDAQRGLSTGERKMLYNARQIMVSELALAENCEYPEAESMLDHAVMQKPAVSIS